MQSLVDALFHGCLHPRVGPRPLGAPCGTDGACGKAAVQGGKRNADAPEFPEGCLRLSEKFSRPLR